MLNLTMEILNLLQQTLEGIVYIVTGATIIARLTPTNKDDKLIEKIRKFIEKASNLFLPNK